MTTSGNGKSRQTGADERLQQVVAQFGLEGRTLYLPQMPYGGSLPAGGGHPLDRRRGARDARLHATTRRSWAAR